MSRYTKAEHKAHAMAAWDDAARPILHAAGIVVMASDYWDTALFHYTQGHDMAASARAYAERVVSKREEA